MLTHLCLPNCLCKPTCACLGQICHHTHTSKSHEWLQTTWAQIVITSFGPTVEILLQEDREGHWETPVGGYLPGSLLCFQHHHLAPKPLLVATNPNDDNSSPPSLALNASRRGLQLVGTSHKLGTNWLATVAVTVGENLSMSSVWFGLKHPWVHPY
ncbi:hypothetical protein BJV74DRAFT_799973 [Russula compacta]|nr:hypothetical protein BJV74DRAFT_799973 [Russula compacta]